MDQFSENRAKFESNYTIVIYDLNLEEVVEKLQHQLNVIKTTRDDYKRRYRCGRFYKIIDFFKLKTDADKTDGIYFVGDHLDHLQLTKKQLGILREFRVKRYIFKKGERFHTEYLDQLLNDSSYKHVIRLQNDRLSHIYLGKHKKRVHHSEESKKLDVKSYVDQNVPERCIVYGSSCNFKTLRLDNHIVHPKELSDVELVQLFENDAQLCIHRELQNYLEKLDDEKLLVGKNLQKGIALFRVKKVFCTEEMYDKLRRVYPEEYLNFEMIKVKSLEKNDVVDELTNNFKGIIGYAYY